MHVTRALALLALSLPALSGCGTTYLLQAARGQWQVMAERRPIPKVIADPRTTPAVRDRLTVLRDARSFASRELALPDNRSYTTYADLDRAFVVWSVVATPEFSVAPLTWCFPVAGCVAYRGYFREAAALAFASTLRQRGLDVTIGGVAAYSTLGRLADPVLSTMLRHDEIDTVATLFHELAHQVAYASGDSAFNEAFAVSVEKEGVARWLRSLGRSSDFARYQERLARQAELVALLRTARAALLQLYAQPLPPEQKRQRKQLEFERLAQTLRAFEARSGRRSGISTWLEGGLNNAHLASVATYWDCVSGFEQLLVQEGGDLPRFYARVKRLARQGAVARAGQPCNAPVPAAALRRDGIELPGAGSAAALGPRALPSGVAFAWAEPRRGDGTQRSRLDAESGAAVVAAQAVNAQ